jgi:putative ABC transport system permease protein
MAHQRHTTLTGDERETIFFPATIAGGRWAIRTSGDPERIAPAVRAAIAAIDPLVPVAEMKPMTDYLDRARAPTRFALVLIGIFAIVAAVLTAVGLYGVLSSVVRQRTAEIGVRMAFGAPRATIFRLVIGQGLRLSGLGIGAGVVGALWLTQGMSKLLVGVKATDPATFASMAAVFLVIAAAASWLPARRASAMDPTVALREE